MSAERIDLTNSNIMSGHESNQSQGILAGRAALKSTVKTDSHSTEATMLSRNPENIEPIEASLPFIGQDSEPAIEDNLILGYN